MNDAGPMHDMYLYVEGPTRNVGNISAPALTAVEERDRLELSRPPLTGGFDPVSRMKKDGARGMVMELARGYPNWVEILIAYKVLKGGGDLFFYWPEEPAVERIDRPALRMYAGIFAFATCWRILRLLTGRRRWQLPSRPASFSGTIRVGAPAPPLRDVHPVASRPRVKGHGVYFRLDYWSRLISGGSYGHTCYVAKKLAERCGDFTCVMAQPYALLDEMGVKQVVLPDAGLTGAEPDILRASESYYTLARVAVEMARPAFIYERAVPGSALVARLCSEMRIPYLLEYNGSELQMRRAFGGGGFEFEELFLDAEATAFRTASAISVVSDVLKQQLVERGIDGGKILVNPNCADPQAYRPGNPDEIREAKARLGWDDSHTVICFVGTFGGWHGIEVLADALPLVCSADDNVRWLMIGNGNLISLIVESVAKHNLGDRVHLAGLLPQSEAAILMRVADIFVSPHHRNIGDMPFFGSPTKLFEYMAMERAIVAGDLGQIGTVLSPALRPADFDRPGLAAGDARAVLCTPGDLNEFVAGVLGLLKRPDIAKDLGRNARQAVLDEFSWDRHVDKLLDFAAAIEDGNVQEEEPPAGPMTLKDEIVKQWDNDPCGSHYATRSPADRLNWFRDVERFRYDEYGPWMREDMEFGNHAGKQVLEIGSGMGTDLAQFAQGGAHVTALDLSGGHLALARENFELRGLEGTFVQGDAEDMPFEDASFDVVYTNGVIHHTPRTQVVIDEILRVLKPGGRVLCMVYAQNSIQFWRDIIYWRGLKQGQLLSFSPGEIMSRSVEISATGARPLVKVYPKDRLRRMFSGFHGIEILQRQLMPHEPPVSLRWIGNLRLQKVMGWNLVIRARKPAA